VAVVHRVAAIACLVVVVAATGLAVLNILAAAGMAYMALGSIGLAVADRVAAHSLVVVIAIDRAVLEVAAYISPSILTL